MLPILIRLVIIRLHSATHDTLITRLLLEAIENLEVIYIPLDILAVYLNL
jgi:hypothetical protein